MRSCPLYGVSQGLIGQSKFGLRLLPIIQNYDALTVSSQSAFNRVRMFRSRITKSTWRRSARWCNIILTTKQPSSIWPNWRERRFLRSSQQSPDHGCRSVACIFKQRGDQISVCLAYMLHADRSKRRSRFSSKKHSDLQIPSKNESNLQTLQMIRFFGRNSRTLYALPKPKCFLSIGKRGNSVFGKTLFFPGGFSF